MSAGRVLLAGILGGIAMFIWTSIAHIATPLGMIGVKEIPNEQAVLTAMQNSMGSAHGLYIFPGTGLSPNASSSERSAAMSKYQEMLDKNPSGILIYHPAGAKVMIMNQLVHEFAFEVFEALLLAILLSMAVLPKFGSRLVFVVVVGLIAAVTTNLSYKNWYGFPSDYTHAAMFVEAMKYVVAGTVIALLLGKVSARSTGA